MKNIEDIKNQTYALIDDLKKTTTENGLAGSGNEYVVIVEIFLYKFLNDNLSMLDRSSAMAKARHAA